MWKRFGNVIALRDISLTVTRGEVVCILGPSGCGKSTLLRCINHLERIDAGQILVNGKMVGYRMIKGRLYELAEADISPMRADTGMVFQQFNLFPHMTGTENVMEAPVQVQGISKSEARVQALDLLARVGLSDEADRYPSALSGGQQQRVAIARALAMRPSILLFDEPTSALDPEMVEEVLAVMREVANDGITMIVVTHEIEFARSIADRIVFMIDGEVASDLPTATFFEQQGDTRINAFLGKLNRTQDHVYLDL